MITLHPAPMRKMLAICGAVAFLLAGGVTLGGGFGLRSEAPVTLLAVGAVTGAPATAAAAPALRGRLRVIDADTFDLGGQRLRLHGVDAPEAGQMCQGAQGRAYDCGRWATDAARVLIGTQVATCRDLGERTHGRIVAACTLDGLDLGAALVSAGIVRACPRYARQHPHAQGYEALEARAIAARVGLHAGRTPELARFCRPR